MASTRAELTERFATGVGGAHRPSTALPVGKYSPSSLEFWTMTYSHVAGAAAEAGKGGRGRTKQTASRRRGVGSRGRERGAITPFRPVVQGYG